VSDGDDLRDKGIKYVTDGQNAVDPKWYSNAFMWIVNKPHGETGKPEDWRKEIEPRYGLPRHPNIYGALVNDLCRTGVIRKTGLREKMKVPKSHSRMTDIWERT